VFTYSSVVIKQANSATPLATQIAILSSVEPTITNIIDTKKENNFTFYPNPTNGVIRLAGNLNNSSAIISDMGGRRVKEFNTLNAGQQIDISDLLIGSYFITILSDGNRTTQKLILH
jgi:hypothetical protein